MKTDENARIGKIAALPAAVREEINMRLLDGQLAPQILPWLNGLPVVQVIMAQRFRGQTVLRQNLSHWREEGYQEWLRARGHAADTSKLVDHMVKQAQTRGETLLESVSTLLAGQLLTVLSQMAEVMGSAPTPSHRGKLEFGVRSAELGKTANPPSPDYGGAGTQYPAAQGESRGNGEGREDEAWKMEDGGENRGEQPAAKEETPGERTIVDGEVIGSAPTPSHRGKLECGVRNSELGETLNLEPSFAKAMEGGPRTSNLEQQPSSIEHSTAQGESREEAEVESKMALMERRLGLIAKATACVARLRKVDQGQEALRLNRERLAVSVGANRIRREKLELMRGKRGQEQKPESARKDGEEDMPTGIHEWTNEELRRLEKTVGFGFGPEIPGETPWEDVKPFDLTPDQKRRLEEAKRRL